jgi:hypothetical protein
MWTTLFQPENNAPFTDFFFGSSLGSGFESGSETFISVPDRIRIRPKVSNPSGSGSGSGSGSATLTSYEEKCLPEFFLHDVRYSSLARDGWRQHNIQLQAQNNFIHRKGNITSYTQCNIHWGLRIAECFSLTLISLFFIFVTKKSSNQYIKTNLLFHWSLPSGLEYIASTIVLPLCIIL